MSLQVKSKTGEEVLCEVVDGGELKSRRHLNVRGKSATLPSITGREFLAWWFFNISFWNIPITVEKAKEFCSAAFYPTAQLKLLISWGQWVLTLWLQLMIWSRQGLGGHQVWCWEPSGLLRSLVRERRPSCPWAKGLPERYFDHGSWKKKMKPTAPLDMRLLIRLLSWEFPLSSDVCGHSGPRCISNPGALLLRGLC